MRRIAEQFLLKVGLSLIVGTVIGITVCVLSLHVIHYFEAPRRLDGEVIYIAG